MFVGFGRGVCLLQLRRRATVGWEGLAGSSLCALRLGDARPGARRGLTLGNEGLGLKWKHGGAGLGVRRGLGLGEAALGLGPMWACAGAECISDAARACAWSRRGYAHWGMRWALGAGWAWRRCRPRAGAGARQRWALSEAWATQEKKGYVLV
ncbi:hypothetical protein L3X38_011394 [Prunus dulcis]|uniref:Uncharacterized protein n=1 Tax=Prunus dulcis TaxID=3755 RepID=A0AAD4WH97_PRUDU|nr:hypothetical protein L3X38_011394 [Prunus dulcis]